MFAPLPTSTTRTPSGHSRVGWSVATNLAPAAVRPRPSTVGPSFLPAPPHPPRDAAAIVATKTAHSHRNPPKGIRHANETMGPTHPHAALDSSRYFLFSR